MSTSSGRRGRQQPIPSSSAQRREPEFPWENLNQCYHDCAAICVRVPQQITGLIGDRDAVALLGDPAKVAATAEILLRDVNHYLQRLQNIHRKHRDCTGVPKTPDELMKQIQIAEEYASWEQSYNLVVVPSVEFIVQAFATIEQPVAAA